DDKRAAVRLAAQPIARPPDGFKGGGDMRKTRYDSPAAVSCKARCERSNSVTPSSTSTSWMLRLTAGAGRCNRAAASVKLGTRAATTNASIDLNGGMRWPMRLLPGIEHSWQKFACAPNATHLNRPDPRDREKIGRPILPRRR